MECRVEYVKVFMTYESADMPVVYFYEVALNHQRLALRAIEVYPDRRVRTYDDLYHDAIEATPIPTVEELNAQVWGEGFFATVIHKQEFDEIYKSGSYDGLLSIETI
ncbi:MAG: hypothetical protein E7485_08580 [Ruminococcaceae bacterium]|nr:hypothetical protein [Oscillospiraceae bacterium]